MNQTPLTLLRSLLITALLLAAGAAGADDLQVSTLAGPLDGAVGGVSVDTLGFIYVADFGEKVWKVTPWGEVEVFARGFYGASGNTIDAEGNLLQSSFYAGKLSKVSRDGTVTTVATGLAGPVGVTENSDGLIYVSGCSGNLIHRIETGGEVNTFASDASFNCPNGLTHDAEGNLYVANFSDGRVLKITPEGEVSVLATVPGGGNGHLARVGTDLYVTSFRGNRIFKVSAEGEVTPVAGTGAFGEQNGAPGEATFSTPNGIAYNPRRDALYVNDLLLTWPQRWEGRTRPQSAVRELLFPTLENVFRAAFEEAGAVAAKGALRAYVASRPGRPYPFVLNTFGYGLLQSQQLPEALTVFELATELFPQNANAWDSLGEANHAAGQNQQAIECYRKSLQLNPANANAAAKLKELGAE